MRGLVCYEEGRGNVVVAGVPFFIVSVRRGEGFLAAVSARRASRQLQRLGVREAVFPGEYPHAAHFTARGIFPPNPLPLQFASAAEIVRLALRDQPVRRVVLIAEGATGALRTTICALRQEVRYFAVALGRGGEVLAEELRRVYGLALENGLQPQQCRADDLALLFSPRPGWEEPPCRHVALYREDLAVEYRPEGTFPAATVDQKQLAAALFNAGALTAEKIRLLRVPCGGRENLHCPPQTP